MWLQLAGLVVVSWSFREHISSTAASLLIGGAFLLTPLAGLVVLILQSIHLRKTWSTCCSRPEKPKDASSTGGAEEEIVFDPSIPPPDHDDEDEEAKFIDTCAESPPHKGIIRHLPNQSSPSFGWRSVRTMTATQESTSTCDHSAIQFTGSSLI